MGTVALDFRRRVDAAREDADADDMAEGMAGPPPDAEGVAEEIHCCPECGTEFTPAEEAAGYAAREAEGPSEAPMVAPDEPEGDFEGFTLRG